MNLYTSVVPKEAGLFFYRFANQTTVLEVVKVEESGDWFVRFLGQDNLYYDWEMPDSYEICGPIELPAVFATSARGIAANRDVQQIADLFLNDSETGKRLRITSDIQRLNDKESFFDIGDKTGDKWRHYFRTEEL